MEKLLENFARGEVAALKLRRLFESYGFQKTVLSKFEDYALYVDNRRFLNTESIITFMDLDGKLMALRPDVTLSLVKNAPEKDTGCRERLYYTEEVFRLSKENREYKMVDQIGLELIGKNDPFSNLEVLYLALESLGVISPDFILDISHSGFVSGMFEGMELSYADESRIFKSIHAKNSWELSGILEDLGTAPERKRQIIALLELDGPLKESLVKAKKLIANPVMEKAWQELCQLSEILCANGWAEKVHLDFSVVNDLTYYNGLIFKGYIQNIPSAVLFGGRYDKLLQRLGKENGAIGFAISLNALDDYFQRGEGKEVDYLILYDAGADIASLMQKARELRRDGSAVRVERLSAIGDERLIRCKQRFYFQQNQLVKG
ncbi:ATP phosphoribosyltransferase regulatory subunit [Oscillospiraceae bacterium MB08-C2-2]|nr:ATP phosphoribosyltransferase regulatory subunit [Oscillospiraceae bacterium MB08-C2-2]